MRISPLVALLLAAPACATNGVPNDPSDEEAVAVETALGLEDGGFVYADEAPQFGDPDAFARADLESTTPFEDAFASDVGVVAMERGGARARSIMLMWGRLPRNEADGVRHDWTGSFTLSRGALVVRRVVAFEDLTDAVQPRTDRSSVSFASKTGPRADGLVVTVLDPTPEAAEPLTLTYQPVAGEATVLALADLAEGPIVVDYADGMQLAAVGRERRDDCEHGFMRGRWLSLGPNVGAYLGIVGDGEGNPIGHVRGIYGEREDGEPVLFGKFISTTGEVQGLIRGSYADGQFRAGWIVEGGEHGRIQGAYRIAPEARSGRFLARWADSTCGQ
jgi:hypothetical protein